MRGLEIAEVFPFTSDDDAALVVALHNEIGREKVSYRHDNTVAEYRAKFNFQGMEVSHFLATNPDGEVVGLMMAAVWIDGTNEHLVYADFCVRRDVRQQGVGRALLRQVAEFAASTGRTMVTADTINTVPAGDAFARTVRAEVAMREVVNTVLVADLDRSMLEQWRAAGPDRAPAYEVTVWDGPYPQEFHEDLARIFVMADEDMPFEDLDLEPNEVTAEMVAEREQQIAGVVERTTAVARHVESGRLVGFSGIIVTGDDHETLNTTLTVVDRDHRGFALGKWIKAAAILRALERYPDAKRLVTENAASNAPMLGINTAIGFKPEFNMLAYQATLDTIHTYLDN